jgi:hypothetical protein
MQQEWRNRIPEGQAELSAFFRATETSPYERRDPYFASNFSAQRVLSNFAWDIYSYNAYLHYRRHRTVTEKPAISERGYWIGHLSAEDTRLLQEIYESCPEETLDPFSFRPGYLFEPRKGVHESMSRINRYFTPSEKFHADFPKILGPLASEIERVSGHFWRVCAVRIFSVRPIAVTHSPHLDGWPLAIKKLYFYPWGADRERGSTEMVDKLGAETFVEGPPGTWVLFENSQVVHQALPNATKERPTIEITVVPAFETDPTLVVAGSNGMFPFYPFEAPLADEATLPNEFRAGDVAHRALKRTAGLAVTLPPGDYSLGVDPYVGEDIPDPPPPGPLDRLRKFLGKLF